MSQLQPKCVHRLVDTAPMTQYRHNTDRFPKDLCSIAGGSVSQ